MRSGFLAVLGFTIAAGTLAAAEVDYVREVKPILTARCTACHGAVRQKARLRLDAYSLIHKGGRSGSAVVPGKSGESPLIEAVLGEVRPRMPPESEGTALSEKDVAVLRAWIDQGAKGPDEPIPEDPSQHWAFRPPTRPPLPAGAAHPVDAFIAAAREKHDLKPNPPADRAVLLRRVYLDLIGLPPTREELHAFLADTSPDAYEKVVDRLLSRPEHGERWGRHWMDIWRYSDPFGNGEEYRYSHRHVWRWRDWIIESLNQDRGYDQMIREMLAGDEIAPADPDTLRATGYLARNWYKFNRNAWLEDTVEHTAQGFLGLTFRCARCHDHKYDPIAQQDYYRLRAFFEPHDIRIDPVSGQPDINKDGVARAFDAKPEAPTYLFVRGDDRNPDKSRALTPGVPTVLGGDLVVKAVRFTARDFARALEPIAEEELKKARQEIATADASVKAAREAVAAAMVRLEKIAANPDAKPDAVPAFLHDTFATRSDEWKPVSGKWEWEKGKLVQKTPGHFTTLTSTKNHPQNLMGRVRYRTLGGPVTSVGFSFDVVGASAWQAVYTHCKPGSTVQAFHRFGGAEAYPPAGIVPHPFKLNEEITLDFAVRGTLLNVWVSGQLKIVYRLPTPRQAGVFALWNHQATSEFLEVRLAELPDSVPLAEKASDSRPSPLGGVVLTMADAEKAVQQAEAGVSLAGKKRAVAQASLAAVEARIAADRAKLADPQPADVMTLALAAGKAERTLAVLKAEEALLQLQQGADEAKLAPAKKALADAQAAAMKESPAYTPLVKADPAGSTGRRLALAEWITRRDNPLTARVAVNHVWMRHFGTPLVASVANFGLNGKKPTHPELLDWLAVEFVESGWSLKKLHRLLVTSQTYRLSSADGESAGKDPENVYLWRTNSRRMEAEVVRDSLLAAAGQLDLTRGGPILDEKTGQTSRRRSLYFRFNTEYKMRFLDQFDAAAPSECYQRRESVIPQQALALHNSALAITNARVLAKRLSEQAKGDAEFVVAAFEQVLTRTPTAVERERCEKFLREQAMVLKEPAKLTAFPPGPDAVVAPSADPTQRARENLVQVLFNHNDFVTIR